MSPARVGPMSQRTLLATLRPLIDDAMAPNSTAHRDMARTELRRLLDTTHWRTTYLYVNLSSRRCRYLASIGYWVPAKWLLLIDKRRPGEDKASDED